MRLPLRYSPCPIHRTAIIWLTVAIPGASALSYDDANTPEGWAWAQIRQGKEANFDARCATPALDPGKDDDRWNDACRALPASFITDLLTREPWRSEIPDAGINIVGARIDQDINLENARLNRVLSITRSRIERNFDLKRVTTDSLISLDRSRIAGNLSADQARSDASLWLRSSHFMQNLVLSYAKFDVNVDMIGATVAGALNADSLRVGVHLLMRSTDGSPARFKNVILRGAKVDGQVSMIGVTVEGTFDADSLHVGSSLLMRSEGANQSKFKDIRLVDATIGAQVDMSGATVEGTLDAYSLHAGTDLLMDSTDRHQASFNGINLSGAKIDGEIHLEGATVPGRLKADSLRVGAHISMRSLDKHQATFNMISFANAQIAGEVALDGAALNGNMNAEGVQIGSNLHMRKIISPHTINLSFAHVNNNLDTRGSTLASLDLSGASVGNLLFGNVSTSSDATAWKVEKADRRGGLNLRNAHVGNLADAPTAWPARGHLRLGGFTFNHLGGLDDESSSEMRGRGPTWWDEWLRRDRTYHPSSYEQLAAAFTASGDRAGADEIRYLSHIRQRDASTHWWPRASSYLFQYTAGFGIGDYTFRVLYWVIAVALMGALYLRFRVPTGRDHGLLWCCGASLSRLLPIIEINKEFTDFFDDPARKRLTGFDTFLFSVVAMVGWLLGAILIAAVSGLVPRG